MRLGKVFMMAAVLIAIPATAAAQTYTPAQNAVINLSQTAVARGGSITATVVGGNSAAQRFVGNITWFRNSVRTQIGQTTADANGGGSLTFVIPANFEVGAHTVEATGTSAAGTTLTVTRAFTVTGASGLARTGSSNTGDMVRVGGAFLVVGAALAYGVRRRQTQSA